MPASWCKPVIAALWLTSCLLPPSHALAQEQQAIARSPTINDPHAIALLPNSDAAGDHSGEQWETLMGSRIVRNVTAPTLTPFLPDPVKATGAAVIVAPGGAFMMLSIDSEGYDVAHWLADHGVAAFVLKYRLKPTPRDTTTFLAQLTGLLSAAGHDAPATPPEALADAQAAVRLVRQRNAEWHLDPHRLGFIGFSAGAITTLSLGLDGDPASRPDFIAPIYGPMNARTIPRDAPPMFTAIAMDDPFFGHSDLGLIGAYQAVGRPIEVHLFEAGGHGFGMRKQGKSSDMWIEEFYTWIKDRGLLATHR